MSVESMTIRRFRCDACSAVTMWAERLEPMKPWGYRDGRWSIPERATIVLCGSCIKEYDEDEFGRGRVLKKVYRE